MAKKSKMILSNTKIDCFKQCPKKYKLWYNDKIRPDYIESPLTFGNAFDCALNRMLLEKKKIHTEEEKIFFEKFKDYIEVFDYYFSSTKLNYLENIDLKTSLRARYSKSDYSDDFLTSEDLNELNYYLETHDYDVTDPIDCRKLMIDSDFADLDNEDRVFLTMGSWMSLRRKGHEMLKVYREQLYPLIDEVIDIQREVKLPELDEEGNETGRCITGKIDFRATLKGKEGIYTIDNKTSSSRYKKNAVETSQQLGIYLEESEDKSAGYFIVIKTPKIIKVKKCLECKQMYEGARKKCEKCQGELDITEKSIIDHQVLLGKPNPEILDETFEEFISIGDDIESGNFPPNFENKCFAFGKKCPYYNYCREGDMTNLVDMNEFWGKK